MITRPRHANCPTKTQKPPGLSLFRETFGTHLSSSKSHRALMPCLLRRKTVYLNVLERDRKIVYTGAHFKNDVRSSSLSLVFIQKVRCVLFARLYIPCWLAPVSSLLAVRQRREPTSRCFCLVDERLKHAGWFSLVDSASSLAVVLSSRFGVLVEVLDALESGENKKLFIDVILRENCWEI